MSFDRDHLVVVGRIIRAHGIRGEVKVLPLTAEASVFFEWDRLFVERPDGDVECRAVETVRGQPSRRGLLLIVKLAGIDSRDDAELSRGAEVAVDRADAPGETFVGRELIGARVVDEEGADIGTVADYVARPPQHLLVIRTTDGREVLVPHVEDLVPIADAAAGRVVVRPIDGLLD